MDSVTLNPRQFERALAVLEREQQANIPTSTEKFFFHLFNFCVLLFACVYILYVVIDYFTPELLDIEWLDLKLVEDILYWPFIFLTIIIFPLFLLNLRFARKLWQQARLRRRLQLNKILQDSFKEQRRRGRIQNVMTWVLIAVFVPVILYPALIYSLGDFGSFNFDDPFVYVYLFGRYYGPLVVLPCLVYVYFMRRGKERLEVVFRLQQTLSEQKGVHNQDPENPINIATGDYDQIAILEREQIFDDRQRSIRRAQKKAYTTDFVIHKSHKVLDVADQLDPDTRVQVEDQILRLISDPRPPEVMADADGFLRLHVPETTLDITYQIEDDHQRIKIYTLENVGSDSSRPQPED